MCLRHGATLPLKLYSLQHALQSKANAHNPAMDDLTFAGSASYDGGMSLPASEDRGDPPTTDTAHRSMYQELEAPINYLDSGCVEPHTPTLMPELYDPYQMDIVTLHRDDRTSYRVNDGPPGPSRLPPLLPLNQ